MCYGSIDPKEKQQIVDEVNILSELKNNHVVGYYKHHLNKATAELRIVMEYCEGGSLASFISTFRQEKRRIPEEAIWKTFTQLVIALLCIHPSSILHRNIKPSNIFLDADRNVKLGDFAFARRLDPEELFSATVLPTTNYMSPEQVKTGIFSKKTDIWALGCLLYEMCTLQPPFLGENEFETARLIRDRKPKKIPYSPELNRAVFWCLEKRPEQRPTVEDLKGIPEINLRIR